MDSLPLKPEWMTREQFKAATQIYNRHPENYTSFKQFLTTISNYGDYAGLPWCGMFLGIEKDGYTHS